ncbi:MAG: hypothetical protein KME49_21010 [Brasilonema octagenarum HA4186-MV1]|jgi:hypothetical protein|uniref:Uncharacterized protein n=1 Tax=Brasilonema sennae CENA114 TaxID=415709 RepID=A0A856MIA3_9CYAN|nr:hypothetical protein [Brasilonema sennae]MBW4627917.1 hypothetical protein [Brasilonema octagenarum HA4186-MV1]QDL08706.1 hypothetical protein DP114_13125 [Brasilonema sennae CENA114]QDL15062.1 hypothetical protein DP113_13065 [Brasilonema octagenarum UFV-E1]
MPVRQTISLLVVLSALIALPAKIASADDIDVEGSTSRVTIDEEGGITIRDRRPTNRTTYPYSRIPSSRRNIRQYSLDQRLRSLRYPRTTQSYCNGRRVVRTNTVRSGSNSANSTYSSTTTSTCQ